MRLLEKWNRYSHGHPRIVFLFACLFALILLVSLSRVTFENNLHVMIPTQSGRVLERAESAFGIQEQSFLIVEVADVKNNWALRFFAESMQEKLEKNPLIEKVEFGFEERARRLEKSLAPYGPRFLTPSESENLIHLFTPEDLRKRLERQLARLSLPGFEESLKNVRNDPLDLGSFLWDRMQTFRGVYRFDPSSMDFISRDGKALLIRIHGRIDLRDMAHIRQAVFVMEEAISQARLAVPEVPLEVYAGGGHFLAVESEQVIRADLITSLSLSMILVFLLMAWTFRSGVMAVIALPPLIVGMLSSIAIYGLLHSPITTLSLGSTAILIGLGVDFAIHLLLRMRSERTRTRSEEDAMVSAVGQTGPGLFFAAMTTIAAFLAFLVSSFPFLRDMGAMTAIGIFGVLITTLVLLPPLARFGSGGSKNNLNVKAPRTLGIDSLVALSLRMPRTVVSTAGGVTILGILLLIFQPPGFEGDLRNIHARDSRALLAERRMEELFGGTPEPLLLLIESESESALERDLRDAWPVLEELVGDGTLMAHASAALLLPDVKMESRWIKRFRSLSPNELEESIVQSLVRAGFDPESLAGAVKRIVVATHDQHPLTLARLRNDLGLSEWIDSFVRPDPDDPDRVLALATLFPARNLWSLDQRDETLRKINSALDRAGVRGDLAGLFTVSSESAHLVATEFWKIGAVAFIVAACVVGLLFRGWIQTSLVLLPVILSCVWTAAIFKFLGYSVHFMNMAVIPMIVGIGIDDGIHILHRYRMLREKSGKNSANSALSTVKESLSVTGTGIALTSLTTMLAFGSLAISRNRGISSLGVLCLIGVGSSLLAAVTVLPVVLYWFEKRNCDGASRSLS